MNDAVPDHYVTYNNEKGIENILNQIHNYAIDNIVLIDNSEFCWMANYLSRVPVKKIDPELMAKATQQYKGIHKILKEKGNKPNGNVYIPKIIADELKQSAEITLINLGQSYDQYNQLTAPTQERFGLVKKALDEMKSALENLRDYAERTEHEEDPVADELADFLNRVKKDFLWGEKAGNKDMHLVARAFSKAMATGREAYIITEDQDIEQISDCLYCLLSCRQTGTDMMFRAHPARVSVLKANKDSEYTTYFDYREIIIGSNYTIRGRFRQFFEKGTVEGSKAIQNAQDRTFELAKKTAILVNTMLNSKAMQKPAPKTDAEEAAKAPTPAEHPIPEEARAKMNAIAAKALEAKADKDPEKAIEALRDLTEAVAEYVPVPDRFENTLEIVREYAQKAYQTPSAPERQKAKTALEELAKAGEDVKEDLRTIKETEIKEEISALAAEIPQIKDKIRQLVDTNPEWDENPEYIKLNQELTLKKDKKKELQSKIYKEA